jgi:alpha/beta superfamily hydrolase
LAACAWARAHWRCEVLWLAGFSFGAAVALEAAAVAKPSALVTVAPPIGRVIVAPVTRPSCPWLVVQGDRDELVDVATVRRWVAEFDLPPRLLELPGAEHFFHGRLGELRSAVHEFLSAGEGAGV